MSLINDALKRAKEAEPPPVNHEGNVPALQPVEYTRHSNTGAVYVSMALLIIGCGIWSLIRGWDATQRAEGKPSTPSASAREPSSTDRTNQPAFASGSPQPEVLVEAEPVQRTPFVRDFSVEDRPAPAPSLAVPAGEASSLRLQAIFYRSSRPSAVINGRTLFVGDHIEGARVSSIARDTVTLQAKGETKVLTLY